MINVTRNHTVIVKAIKWRNEITDSDLGFRDNSRDLHTLTITRTSLNERCAPA